MAHLTSLPAGSAARLALRRRRSRGAAMVEAAVAIPFFTIIFASLVYALHVYSLKEHTIAKSKQNAWQHALMSCEGSVENTNSTTDADDPMSDMAGAGADDYRDEEGGKIDQIGSAAGGDEVTKSWGTTKSREVGYVIAPRYIGGFQTDVATATWMQCNEKMSDGSILGGLEAAYSLFKEW